MKKIKEIMTPIEKDSPVVRIDDPLIDVAQFAVKYQYRRCLYVVDHEGKLKGVLMLYDLLKHLLRESTEFFPLPGASSLEIIDVLFSQTAQDIMKRHVVAFNEEEDIRKAVTKMLQLGVKDAPVVNTEGKVVGYISLVNLIEYALKHQI